MEATRSTHDDPGNVYVRSTSDGDTIVVSMNGSEERVRLIGVDTPETHRPNTPVQCYGPEASAFTRAELLGKNVRLESDPLSSNRDRYDRLLRYVYVDNQLFNESLLRTGHAMAYTSFEFSKAADFMKLKTQPDRKTWVCGVHAQYFSRTASLKPPLYKSDWIVRTSSFVCRFSVVCCARLRACVP